MINLYCYVSANYGYGIVMSNRPLRDSELFEVRITDLNDQLTDSGLIEVGITTLQSDTMELPDRLLNIQSNTWWMSGYNIRSNQEFWKINYGINLNSLKVIIHTCMCSASVYAYM